MIEIKNRKDVKTLLIMAWWKSNFLENCGNSRHLWVYVYCGSFDTIASQQAKFLVDNSRPALVTSNKMSIFLSRNKPSSYFLNVYYVSVHWALCTHLLFWIISPLWGTSYYYYTLFIDEPLEAQRHMVSKCHSGGFLPKYFSPIMITMLCCPMYFKYQHPSSVLKGELIQKSERVELLLKLSSFDLVSA